MAQYFKGDATELKYYNSGAPLLDVLSSEKDAFFENAYDCFVLGEVLYDNSLAPLANAIPREIFRTSFSTVFEAFLVAGSFESYITVFKNIFGEDVEITFTVPGPGQLNIDIVAAGVAQSPFIARYIQSNAYFFDNVVDDEGDQIVFQTILGFESQYELEQMLFEMVPAGIYTEITLTVGE